MQKSQKKSGQNDVFPSGFFYKAQVKIEGESEKSGGAQISRDKMVVAQDVGVESVECKREKPGGNSSQLPRPMKDEPAQKKREKNDRQARPENYLVGIVA